MAVVAALLAGGALIVHRAPSVAAPEPPPLSHTTRNLDLVLGEGEALRQRAVPVRLPLTLEPLYPPPQDPIPPSEQYFGTVVVSQAQAPQLSLALLTLPPVTEPRQMPALPKEKAFPVNRPVPGYAVILGPGPETVSTASLTSSTTGLTGIALAFIGEPTAWARLPPTARQIPLGQGLTASIYTARAVHVLGGGVATPAALLAWREGPDTYAIYSVGYSTAASTLSRLARSMARSLIRRPTSSSVDLREFIDTNVFWWDASFQGVLKTERIVVRPAGTPGYATRDGLGIRIGWTDRRVTASPAPPWPSPSAANPVPVLARALPDLASTGIPVRLPSFVPLQRGLWPRLDINAGPNSYSVFIRESAVNLPPNTAYAVGVGLEAWVGTVEGSRSPIVPNNVPATNDGPPVRQDQITGRWPARDVARGYYRGLVVLTNGVTALLAVDMAGDGNHTEVLFREDGVYYEVGNYHSARLALKMAASMVGVLKDAAPNGS